MLGAVLLLPLTASAQEGQAGQTPPPQAANAEPEAELAFEREVFAYPAFSRRNPFTPLLSSDEGGPRWEGMRLEGIVYDADPRFSIAIVSSGRAGLRGQQAPTATSSSVGEMARLRVGERWGNVRILEIRKNNVLIEVEEFGLTEQRTMRLPVRGEGGPR
jgi:hypothetical protein